MEAEADDACAAEADDDIAADPIGQELEFEAAVVFNSSSIAVDSSFKSKRVLLMESVRAGMNRSWYF